MKMNRMLRRRRHPVARFASENSTLLIAGAAAGAALLYLSSARGRRQGRLALDRAGEVARSAGGAVGERARMLRDRTTGYVSDARSRLGASAGARPAAGGAARRRQRATAAG
jgi:hypothetical protein